MVNDKKGFWMSIGAVLKTAFGTDEGTRRCKGNKSFERAASSIDRLIDIQSQPVPAETIADALEQMSRRH